MGENSKIILAVAFDDVKDIYTVDIPAGSSVPETAFGMAIVIKCLIRDNIIDSADQILELVKKYVDDPQYEEVK